VVVPIISRLKRRPDFLAAAKGLACARGAVNAQARFRGDDRPLVRIGFTATKRIGGAVVRNRAKRRLREAARLLAPLHVIPGCDYVFIARGGTPGRPWGSLLDDMTSALTRLAADLRAHRGETPLNPISGPITAEPTRTDEALSAP
jgi:ribonuclease P protein component